MPVSLVSLIIPVRDFATEEVRLSQCLDSIWAQSYPCVEVIVVLSNDDDLSGAFDKRMNARSSVVVCETGKSAARNEGARLAKGDFLLHLDVDMKLTEGVLEQCVKVIQLKDAAAVIIPEVIIGHSFWAECRGLEKKLYVGDASAESARFVSADVFRRLGGFDPSVDPMDEPVLQGKLLASGAKIVRIDKAILVRDEYSLVESCRRKYHWGRVTRVFELKYPHAQHTNVTARLHIYTRKLPGMLLVHPMLSTCLLLLKMVEFVSFFIGKLISKLHPSQEYYREINRRLFDHESDTYEKKFYQDTLGGRYVDEMEKNIVLEMLRRHAPPAEKAILLDAGMGSGRWSELLISECPAASVIGIDIAPNMASLASERLEGTGSGRFLAVVGDMEHLPFAGQSLVAVTYIRSLKYVLNYQEVLGELNRVLHPGGILILEVPYANIIALLMKWLALALPSSSRTGILSYLARVNRLFTIGGISKDIRSAGMCVKDVQLAFTVPATLYAKVNDRLLLKCINIVGVALPQILFGRSVFLCVTNADTSGSHGDEP